MGFSLRWGLWAQWLVVHGFSCSAARGIFPDQGLKLRLHLAGRFLTEWTTRKSYGSIFYSGTFFPTLVPLAWPARLFRLVCAGVGHVVLIGDTDSRENNDKSESQYCFFNSRVNNYCLKKVWSGAVNLYFNKHRLTLFQVVSGTYFEKHYCKLKLLMKCQNAVDSHTYCLCISGLSLRIYPLLCTALLKKLGYQLKSKIWALCFGV